MRMFYNDNSSLLYKVKVGHSLAFPYFPSSQIQKFLDIEAIELSHTRVTTASAYLLAAAR